LIFVLSLHLFVFNPFIQIQSAEAKGALLKFELNCPVVNK